MLPTVFTRPAGCRVVYRSPVINSSLAEDTMSDGEASSFEALRLTPQQTETLVASLDRNADGVIDYEEFLVALQARDTMQM